MCEKAKELASQAEPESGRPGPVLSLPPPGEHLRNSPGLSGLLVPHLCSGQVTT